MRNGNAKWMKYLLAISEDAKSNPQCAANMQHVATLFGVNRSTVFRALAPCLENGYLDRNYRLTEAGQNEIALYKVRKERLERSFMAGGLSAEAARENAYAIMENCTEDAVTLLLQNRRGEQERGRQLPPGTEIWRGISGAMAAEHLRKWLPDGSYQMPYTFLKEHPESPGQGRSMANGAFEYPARMDIVSGEGALWLKRKRMRQQNIRGRWIEGMAAGLKYELDNGMHEASLRDGELEIPLTAFYITYEEERKHARLIARVVMSCTAGSLAMPEKSAYLEAWLI